LVNSQLIYFVREVSKELVGSEDLRTAQLHGFRFGRWSSFRRVRVGLRRENEFIFLIELNFRNGLGFLRNRGFRRRRWRWWRYLLGAFLDHRDELGGFFPSGRRCVWRRNL